MSGITGSGAYREVKSDIKTNIETAKTVQKDTQKHIKKSNDSKRNDHPLSHYFKLDNDLNKIQDAKLNLLENKGRLNASYKGISGKAQKVGDFFKLWWGPKAKIKTEIRHLDSLQRNVEKRMARLSPERFMEKENTLINQDKMEKKLIKEDLKSMTAGYKEGVKAYKKLAQFANVKPYIEMKPQNPSKAVKDFKSFSSGERKILTDLFSYQRVEAAMKKKPIDPQKVQNEMDILRMDIKNNLPEFKENLGKLREEIKEATAALNPKKKLGYEEL